MIIFKRGERSGIDTTGIVVPDFDEFSRDDLYLNPLADDCWILTVPNSRLEALLINAEEADFDFVPNEQDMAYSNYDMFWDSELTILFPSYQEALDYLVSYEGPLEEQISALYDNQLNPIDDVDYD
ncbi:MAG: hypothetical protein Wins2KO_31780 [Winogradskyella sp.]